MRSIVRMKKDNALKSGSKLTRDTWSGLNAEERATLKSNLRRQNLVRGNMSPRAATEKVREQISQIEQAIKNAPQQHTFPKLELAWSYRADELLDSILPTRKKDWIIRPKRKSPNDVIIENFSFIDNPRLTFDTLREFLRGEATALLSKFHFDDRNVQDISAYILLAVMYNRMNRYGNGGRMPLSIQKVLKSVGLGETMKIGLPGGANTSDVYPFAIRSLVAGTQTSTSIQKESSQKDKIASDLDRCIREWLAQMPGEIEIDTSALQKIGSFVGEVLDNAERHSESSENGGWWIAGFMARM